MKDSTFMRIIKKDQDKQLPEVIAFDGHKLFNSNDEREVQAYIAVPERGARLGNFCCTALPDGSSMVVASEWMQTTAPDHFNWRRCMEYGADNSIFFSHVIFD